MEIYKYNQGLSWYTRPKDPVAKTLAKQFPGSWEDYKKAFSKGYRGSMEEFVESTIQRKPILPEPKPERPVADQYQDYKQVQGMFEPRTQMYIEKELGFDEGGQVIGKPGGLVEPGVTHYGTSKVKTDKFKYKISNQFGTYYTDKPGVRIGEKPLTAAEKMARHREKNPYKKKTVDITIKGKKYTFTPPTGSVVQQGTKDLFKDLITGVEKWKEKPTTENWVNIFKEKKPSKIGPQQFQYGWSTHLRNYIQGKPVKSNIAKALFDQSDIKNLLNLDEGHVNLIKGYKNLQSPAMATKAAAEKLLWKSAEKVIAINNQFKQNPKITLEQLTKNLYKKEFTKAGETDKLRLLTTVSDDVAKYLEALKNAREIPKGLKSKFIAPTGKNLDNIQKYITSQTEGFRFRDGTLRNYKYSIRDSILGFKQGYTQGLENKLKIKGVLDHAVGLSATHEVAPGYTGLYQDLENSLNKVKGTDIDRDFTKVLKEVIKDKNFKNVDAYNAQASKFHKKHKGKIDVPFIRQGGDPTKLVTSFYDLDEPSQKNILKLAEGPQGIAIETKGKTIKPSRGGVTLGTTFSNVTPEMLDFRKLPGDLSHVTRSTIEAARAAGKSPAFINALKKARTAGKFTGAALAAEPLFVAPFVGYQYLAGDTPERIWGDATFGLFGQTGEEEIRKATGERGYATQQLSELGPQLQALQTKYESLGDTPEHSAKRQEVENKYKWLSNKYNKAYNMFVDDTGQFNKDLYNQALNNYTAGIVQIDKFKKQLAGERREKSMEGWTDTESNLKPIIGFAGGGIASLTRTVAPPRGPQHMGLASFKKRGR